jgi:starch synthase
MVDALRRSLAAFANPDRWRELMLRGMTQDYSWRASARDYLAVYERAAELGRLRRAAATRVTPVR